MHIIIIPGFIGHPDEVTFKDLTEVLTSKGHTVTKVAWPNFPKDLKNYTFTNTISTVKEIITELNDDNFILLGFSMGGIIATFVAAELKPKKLGLIVSPYQAGSGDDLAGKYKDWQTTGFRTMKSSKFGELEIPFSFIEDAQQYNALDVISTIDCPKLFIAGEKDEKISSEVSQKFCAKSHDPKELQIIPNMQHKYQYQDGMLVIVNNSIISFIEKTL